MTAEGKGKNQQMVLEYLKECGPATASEISNVLNIPLTGSWGGVYKILNNLPQVQRVGYHRPYLWVLNE